MTEKTAEKVTKSEAEWKKQLTDEQYHVTREAGTECAFTGKYWDTKNRATITVCAAGSRYLIPRRSSIQGRAGLAFTSRLKAREWSSTGIPSTGWSGRRFAVPSATHISGMSLKMGPRPPACGIA